jgi:hypothetical protein
MCNLSGRNYSSAPSSPGGDEFGPGCHREKEKRRELIMFKKWELFFLSAAFISFLFSNALWFGVVPTETPHEAGIYVGHWVTSILSMMAFLKVFTESSRK